MSDSFISIGEHCRSLRARRVAWNAAERDEVGLVHDQPSAGKGGSLAVVVGMIVADARTVTSLA